MGGSPARFLLDSGAGVSVVRYDALESCWQNRIAQDGPQNAIAANGLPLEVMGRVKIRITLGEFQADQVFTVVKELSVECILGADFLVKHAAVIDCKARTLAVGENPCRCTSQLWARGDRRALEQYTDRDTETYSCGTHTDSGRNKTGDRTSSYEY